MYDVLINRFKSMGCDIDGTLERMLNDKEFMIQCMCASLDESEYDLLKKALEENNVSHAFDYAHALKGVTSNVGLTPLYNCIVEIVEPLRNGKTDNLDDKLCELFKKREEIRALFKSFNL